MKKKKLSFRRSSLPAMYALAVAIILAITIVSCSEVQAAHDTATVLHPDGSRSGRGPAAPFGNPARGCDVPPPPQQRRRLHHHAGRSAGAGSDDV
ncbi:hypothetical protein SETIT_5G076700v2 [Setaria italica]|nr:hypothetical protein SETIT_5G076700v2 [Setaria italica]